MSRWKLIRQKFGTEEYEFDEGNEVTIGRDLNNTVALKSLVISRNHCIMCFKKDEVIVTDLKSSNGVFIGLKKLVPNVPFSVNENDIIGIGWTYGVQGNIQNDQKYVFELQKVKSLVDSITFQDEELSNLETELASLIQSSQSPKLSPSIKPSSPILHNNSHLKRKLSLKSKGNNENVILQNSTNINANVIVLTDSENEEVKKVDDIPDIAPKKIKKDSVTNDVPGLIIKFENDNLEYEAFKIKEEYSCYDHEPLEIDSDSESEHWLMRLSQSSPGKPFIKDEKKSSGKNSSYSQLDEDVFIVKTSNDQEAKEDELMFDELLHMDDPNRMVIQDSNGNPNKDIISTKGVVRPTDLNAAVQEKEDHTSIKGNNDCNKIKAAQLEETMKKTQLIEPLLQTSTRKSRFSTKEARSSIQRKSKSSSSKTKTSKTDTSSRSSTTKSLKEERKKKLKEIATKDKDDIVTTTKTNNLNKSKVNVKVTSSNRGAFLTNVTQQKTKSLLEKENNDKTNFLQSTQHKETNSPITGVEPVKHTESKQNKKYHSTKKIPDIEDKAEKRKEHKPKKVNKTSSVSHSNQIINGVQSDKPVSIVVPLPHGKPKKRVRFCDDMLKVHVFQIEPGNRMKKTSTAKTSLIEKLNKQPIFSLEKITLMKVLRWNPQWLGEQLTNPEPPPILGHDNIPKAIFHCYDSHKQYVEMVGDLLLMEIWECLTQGYVKDNSSTNSVLPFRIESIPPVPPLDRCFELINISVNFSVPYAEQKKVPRVGEVLMIEMGNESSKICRFFYVHNVRTLPSPSSNKFSFFSISLYTTFTDKMRFLKPGELIKGKILAYIHKELSLFEAIDSLANSPLSEAILRPRPQHFASNGLPPGTKLNSQWMGALNESQKIAVSSSVGAALGSCPSIQMVQGPPGTGKSSVICSIVMSYFYDAAGKRLHNRGKVLICATSNAAVDGLVIRLLNIRQELPKSDRFRMVRVGRLESMHPRARDISSQQLAQRDARTVAESQQHSTALAEEIAHLEAKINMWKTAAREAKDPVRVAYCQGRLSSTANRLAMLQYGGSGAEPRPEQLVQSERRIIECADIVVTTLGSAHSHKMKGIKDRITLCIIDEAGQAIEPEALIPLTLGVKCLTLVGDPQQLPGFICSQRAKVHGLGESLFSRLSSYTENWDGGNPVILLDKQYRMHPAIADYPNRAFYNSQVYNMTSTITEINIPAYCIVNVSSGDRGQSASGANETEAWGVARLAGALLDELRGRRLTVALITPYAAHRDLLRRCLHDIHGPAVAEALEINTVDSFQGQERDVVLVSLARSSGVGFLTDTGRMNVMLTRARLAMIVCLNSLALMSNNQWRTLVEDAQRRRLYTSLPSRVCQRYAEAMPPGDVLACIDALRPRPNS